MADQFESHGLSQAIYDSLSHVLGSPITYLTSVEHNGAEYYFCTCSHSFFILESKLDHVRAEVFYAHVLKLVVDTSKKKLLMIQLSDGRGENVPSKLILKTENRKALIDHLKISWKTDHMFRIGRVIDLPVFQAEISASNVPLSKNMALPAFLFEPMNQWDKFEIREYKFQIPNAFKRNSKNDYIFIHSNPHDKMDYKILVQVSDDIPLDALAYMDGHEEISLYCEEYAIKLISGEPKAWIISSKPYFKKMNLNQDLASWQGWEVQIKTPKREIVIILLRRIYIPPLLDYFVDFFVIVEASEKNVNHKAHKKRQVSEVDKMLENGRKVADSFTCILISTNIYSPLIKRRLDSLYYDEETLNYFQYRLPNKIMPKFVLYGAAFILNIASIIQIYEMDLSILKDILFDKYKEQYEIEWTQMEEKWDPLEDPPTWEKLIEILENKLLPYNKKKKEGKNNWSFKVSKYLAYCVDGGLLDSYFNLSFVVEVYLKNSTQQNAEELNKIILYLLHLRDAKATESFSYEVSLQTKIFEMIYSKGNYIYNEKVMANLIEAGYFKKELIGSDKPMLYSNFLTYMLENNQSPFIKSSICIQINREQNEAKSSTLNFNFNINEVKPLIRPLIILYQGDNLKLATVAAVALASLCSKVKEIKQFVMKEGDSIILQQLDGREENLLFFTLKLLQSLMLVTQNVQTFVSKGLIAKIIDIIKGTGIRGVYYSDQILTLTCQTLSLIANDLEDCKNKIPEYAEMLMNLFKIPRPKPIADDLVAEIINLFMIKLIEKDKFAIEKIGEQSLDVLLLKLKEDFFKTKELQKRILTFLLGFKDSDNMLIKINQANITSKIEEYKGEHDQKASLLLKIIENASKKSPTIVECRR